jgi:hypothetical protein
VYNTNETTGAGVYVWNGKWWWPAATPDIEQIALTVRTTANDTYSIPTSGRLSAIGHTYDWDITIDGQPIATVACPDGRCTGTGAQDSPGIELTGLDNGDHRIRITPHGGADPGWGNAFGHSHDNPGGANNAANKQKMISIDAPITTMAFAPKISESASNAAWMFADLFAGCSNLTTAAVIKDTYKLPGTITDLSYFLFDIHQNNANLTDPVDLSSLSGWLAGNQMIKNLSGFFYGTHSGNVSLSRPVDLAPLSGWFNGNTSITNLSGFLYATHSGNSLLIDPINLAPLSDWFNDNQKINNLGAFLGSTHSENGSLSRPVYLAPLSGWFAGNQKIENLSAFLHSTHLGDTLLTDPIDLAPLSGWFSGNSSITNLSSFFMRTHYMNTALTAPINFMPLSGWFNASRTMNSLDNFFDNTHYDNPGFTLSGQTFPDWIETMILTGGTPIWNVAGAFFHTFLLSIPKSGNSEPVFFSSSNCLSGLGKPTVTNFYSDDPEDPGTENKGTYTGRNDITPSNDNWK